MANDFRNCAVVTAWVRCRWKSRAFPLDCLVSILPALSGGDWLGADVSASLLVAAAIDGRATAKHLADHSTRSSHVRLVVRRGDISTLVLIRRWPGTCGSVDDFSKSVCTGNAHSGRVIAQCASSSRYGFMDGPVLKWLLRLEPLHSRSNQPQARFWFRLV